jgi:hypothetical protein
VTYIKPWTIWSDLTGFFCFLLSEIPKRKADHHLGLKH